MLKMGCWGEEGSGKKAPDWPQLDKRDPGGPIP